MNLRRFLQRHLGHRESFKRSRVAGWLGTRLHDPEIWHLGRRSVAGGVGLGFFLAFIPIPIQMPIGTVLAVLTRVNLPVTLAAVWLTNPLTMAPMFYFAYKVGSWIVGVDSHLGESVFEPTLDGALTAFRGIWLQLTVGCLVCGASAGALGNLAVRWLWRAHLVYRRRQRQQARFKPPL